MKILTISGSLRKDSFNTRLLHSLAAIAPEGTEYELLDYSSLPLYNQDLEVSFPPEALAIKEKISTAEGIIISTPEHNRSIPAALKSLLDWTSRPYGEGGWVGKMVYVMGVTPADTGTTQAQGDLRKILLYLNAKVLGQPESYISGAYNKFNAEGMLIDEATTEHLRKALVTFNEAVEKAS